MSSTMSMLASVRASSLCIGRRKSSSCGIVAQSAGAAMTVIVRHEVRPEGGNLARLTIDNATKLNSLNRVLMNEIIESAERLAVDPRLRLVILTGVGDRAFVGGADIGEIAALDRDSAREFITLVHRCCDAFRRMPVPVIARID